MRKILACLGPLGLLASAAAAGEVTLVAVKDNTLYEDAEGDLSNGSGDHFFAGRTGQITGIDIRRGLIEFDLTGAVPTGFVLTEVRLRLHMSMTPVGDRAVALHRVLAEWGEAGSDAPSGEGSGAPAQTDDATWLHTFYPSSAWSSAGGDFAASASASTIVGTNGFYEWSSPQMAADVQAWIDDPLANHGWIAIGDEAGPTTAKRFDTREIATSSNWPMLIVSFAPPITPYCFGLGCPCSNDDPTAGCANGSFLLGSELDTSGTPSVSADTLVLIASRSTPNQPGLFFQGDNAVNGGAGSPFGDGLRCAGGSVVRLEVRVADGAGNAASSVGIAAIAGTSPGDLKRYQWWYRDPMLSPCGTGFNLSNGVELSWLP